MKFAKRRKLNCRINDVYNDYKKDKEVNGITFKIALKNLYSDFKDELSPSEFNSFLKYRYKFLRNDYKGIYNLAIKLITAFVPAVCINLFNDKAFVGIEGSRLIMAILFAFFVIVAFTLFVMYLSGRMIIPWINAMFNKSYIDKQNDEVELVFDKLNKRYFQEKINKKEIGKATTIDAIWSVVLSTIIWIILCFE